MKYDLSYAINFAEQKNGKCLSDKYSSTQKMKWQCNVCSTKWEANFYSLHNKGTWCPYCADPVATKTRHVHLCTRCSQEFVSFFSKNASNAPKYCSRLCYRRDNTEKSKDSAEKYKTKRDRDGTPIKSRYNIMLKKSKTIGLASDISLEAYSELIKKPCFYCKNIIQEKHGVSLDRKNSELGYTLNNVVPCCGKCNQIKNVHLTHEEMVVAMQSIIAYRQSKT